MIPVTQYSICLRIEPNNAARGFAIIQQTEVEDNCAGIAQYGLMREQTRHCHTIGCGIGFFSHPEDEWLAI